MLTETLKQAQTEASALEQEAAAQNLKVTQLSAELRSVTGQRDRAYSRNEALRAEVDSLKKARPLLPRVG